MMLFHFHSLTRHLLLVGGTAGFCAVTSCESEERPIEPPNDAYEQDDRQTPGDGMGQPGTADEIPETDEDQESETPPPAPPPLTPPGQ